ncbi:MAG: hypothetical protein KF699_01470 [Phycisphaeraceae bacterium]|nr:hypothetical protein [Phycisphaeraceae bacterium]
MRPLISALAFALFIIAPALAAPPIAPPSGTYTGEGLTVVLKRGAGDTYTGTVSLNGRTYPLDADFDEDDGLTGTFEVGDDEFDFTAVLKGGTLTFTTGGTVYKLAAPASAQPANPLAKKPPANPLDKNPDAKPALPVEGALKLKRLSIKDPGINNIEAVSFLIPEGWKHEGGITWMHDYSILANLLLKITDPATGAQVEYLPMQNFSWIDNPPFPMQNFSNYMGNLIHPPIRDAAAFVRTMYMPQALPHLQRAKQVEVERLEKVEQQYAAAVAQAPAGGQASVYSGRVRYEYEREGKVWEEDVYIFLSYYTGQGMTIWSVSSAYSFRAPKAADGGSGLDKAAPVLTTITNTARVSQDWFSGYMYVSQLFRDRQMQGIRDATRLSRMISENAEHTRQLYAQAYADRNASQERINRSFGEYIRGVETYTNPYESREVQLPAGYTDAWVNPQGEYLLIGPGGHDPNVGSTVEWRRMKMVE